MNSSIDETSVSCQLILTPEELQIILAFRLQKQLVLDRAVPIETISAETDSNNMEIHCSNLITKATEASTHTISIQTSNTEIIKKGKKCINTAKTQNFQSGLSPFYRHAHFNQSRMSSQFGIVPKQVHRVYSIGGKILPSEMADFFLIESRILDSNSIRTDEITGFSFIVRDTETIPGLYARGFGVFAAQSVTVNPKIKTPTLPLLIAQSAVFCPKKLRKFFKLRGYFLHGAGYLTERLGPVNLLNTINAVSSTTEEVPNVYLRVVSGITLKQNHPNHVGIQTLSNKMYPCVFPLLKEKIENTDQLFFGHYGRSSDMAYGKNDYIDAQQECLSFYEALLISVAGNVDLFCQNCYEIYPKFEDQTKAAWLLIHNITCNPYMSHRYEPSPQGIVMEDLVEIK